MPDAAVQSALDASLGYLLLAGDPMAPISPLAHNAVWTATPPTWVWLADARI
ncbi:MAG: hypothetical protein R3C44_12860 [Chloroflexota bacterium]